MSAHGLSKVAVAIGGFLIFVGIIMVGVSALAFSGVLDVSALKDYQMLFLWGLLVIGVLDVVSGIILRHR